MTAIPVKPFRYTSAAGEPVTVPVYDGVNLFRLDIEPATPFTAETLLEAMNAQGIRALQLDRWNEDFGRWESYRYGYPFGKFNVVAEEEYLLHADVPSFLKETIGVLTSMMVVVMMSVFMMGMGRKMFAPATQRYLLPATEGKREYWLEPFYFRGLKFREHSGGIGIQVYHPEHKRWYDIEGLNWRTSKRHYSVVPDVGLWIGRSYHGSLRFPQPSVQESETPKVLPQVLLIEGGEPVPPRYRDLVGLISEPLPEYSLAVLPAVVPEVGERKIEAVLRQLKDGVEGIQDSYQFRLFLITMSKFHDYSIGNLILIGMQKPEATHVAGFVTWKDLGRWVRAGEKGIAILAPVMPPRATCPKCGAKIPKGARFCPQCREEVEREIEVSPRYFKVVHIFDISQTEGKPLPEFEVPVLTGEVNEELFGNLLALMKKRGLRVSFESRPHLPPEIKGQYRAPDEIWVRPEEPRAQQLKSLLHEVAHYYSEGVFRLPRRDAETIAESAAYVVGAHHDFDTGVRSFPYVALWAQDKKVLEQNLGAIRRVATTILEDLEKVE